MLRSTVDIQSTAAEIRGGKKRRKKKPQGKNVMVTATIKSIAILLLHAILQNKSIAIFFNTESTAILTTLSQNQKQTSISVSEFRCHKFM